MTTFREKRKANITTIIILHVFHKLNYDLVGLIQYLYQFYDQIVAKARILK